jgi:hypothetical protein
MLRVAHRLYPSRTRAQYKQRRFDGRRYQLWDCIGSTANGVMFSVNLQNVKDSRKVEPPGNVHTMVRRSTPVDTKGEKYSPADEASVVDLLSTYLQPGFAGRTWRQQRELVVGSSIADLVLFSAGARTFRFPEPLSIAEPGGTDTLLSLCTPRRGGSVARSTARSSPSGAGRGEVLAAIPTRTPSGWIIDTGARQREERWEGSRWVAEHETRNSVGWSS